MRTEICWNDDGVYDHETGPQGNDPEAMLERPKETTRSSLSLCPSAIPCQVQGCEGRTWQVGALTRGR